jgi:hypothetical protein
MEAEWDDEHRNIPTLEVLEKGEEPGEEPWVKVANHEDFVLLVQSMGWKDVQSFTNSTGVNADDLIGKFFYIVHNHVYVE